MGSLVIGFKAIGTVDIIPFIITLIVAPSFPQSKTVPLSLLIANGGINFVASSEVFKKIESCDKSYKQQTRVHSDSLVQQSKIQSNHFKMKHT